MESPRFEILYFTSTTCNVCKVLLPALHKEVTENFPHISFNKVVVEEEPAFAAQHSIYSAPVILLLIDGREYIREGRNISIDAFLGKVKRLSELAG